MIDLQLPTTEANTGSGEKKKALPAGSYQAKLAYYYFDSETFMGTTYTYQDVGFRWLIVPGEALDNDVEDEDGTIAEFLDDDGFYPYTDKFNELLLKASWTDKTSGRTMKASPFIRRLNALAGNFGTSFSEQHGKQLEYIVSEEKFESVGEFEVYKSITKKEADAYRDAHGGADPDGSSQYKATGAKQMIYRGVVNDIKVNGRGTAGGWVALDLGVNAKNYNTAGANAVRALNHLEKMGLKGAGYELPGVGGAKVEPAKAASTAPAAPL